MTGSGSGSSSPLTRRWFLGGAAAGAGLVLTGGLSACGSDDDAASTTGGSATTGGATSTAGGATSTAAGATSTSAAGGALIPATLQLSWLHSVQFGGSYLAQSKGYYGRQGLEVTLTPGGPNAPVDPPVIAGEALVGISAADYAGRSVVEGAPFKIIGVAMQKNPFVIASLTDNPVTTPADLVGKSIGMATINQPVLDALAKFNDFDAGAVTVVPTQYDPAPLVNGEVECLLCWLTDLPVAMTTQGIDNTTMLLADYGYTVHSQTYIVTEESLADRRDEVLRLVRGEILGWQDYQGDTAAAAALTVEQYPDAGLDLAAQELQASEQLKLMFSDVTEENGFLWFTDESVEENVATLAELGVEVTADLWDRSLLEEIYADGPVLS
ncbi:MAG: ABC transporter substrate-binding protein [Ilumatobacteraceae bacterium]